MEFKASSLSLKMSFSGLFSSATLSQFISISLRLNFPAKWFAIFLAREITGQNLGVGINFPDTFSPDFLRFLRAISDMVT
jgi:hypothetical protein